MGFAGQCTGLCCPVLLAQFTGKSTIINLMMRMYDVDEGCGCIAGKDVRSYRPEELEKKFGVVFRNDIIFEDTISGNVSLGREMSEEQIQEALWISPRYAPGCKNADPGRGHLKCGHQDRKADSDCDAEAHGRKDLFCHCPQTVHH